MSQAAHITDPGLLKNFFYNTIQPLNHSNTPITSSSKPKWQKQQVKLVLLQPLANADMLQTCRTLHSRPTCKHNRSSEYGYVDIKALSKSWREKLLEIPPISHLIFDLTLPKADEETDKCPFQKVCWETAMQDETSVKIHTRDVLTMVNTIATEVRMRSDGEVSFELIYDDTEGVPLKGMKFLKKQLLALSTRANNLEIGLG